MAVLEKIRAGLVELRTDRRSVYVSPSFWNRVYLLWTFRNFSSLPRQVLNRHERELIERLCRVASFSETRPIARSRLIGAVENVRLMVELKPEAEVTTGKVIAMGTTRANITPLAVGSEGISIRPSAAVHKRADIGRFGRSTNIRKISALIQPPARQSRNRLACALTVSVGVAVLGSLLLFREAHRAPPVAGPRAGIQIRKSLSGSALAVPIAESEKVRQSVQPERKGPATTVAAIALSPASHRATLIVNHPSDAIADSTPLQLLEVAEAPRSGFGYPVAPNPALTGKVSLTAVIGTNGAVREVVVLQGNPALARAAARAVRHWQYQPQVLNGHPVEAETKITINFVGDDTVSVSFPTLH